MAQQNYGHDVYAQVAVEASGMAGKTFTYLIPDSMREHIRRGSRVLVPFGPRQVRGCVVGLTTSAPPVKLKPIARLLDEEGTPHEAALSMAEWIATQWHAPLADCLRLFEPPGGSRRISQRVRLRSEDLTMLARAPKQRLVAECLSQLGGEATLNKLLSNLRRGSWPDVTTSRLRAALRSLEREGVVAIEYQTTQRGVKALERKHVGIADMSQAHRVLDELRARAPRQAMVLQTLLAAHPRWIPASELSAPAVSSLQAKGLVVVEERIEQRRAQCGLDEASGFLEPLPEQRAAIQRVARSLANRQFAAILLHGVTGSGKTEVYLHCLRAAMQAGRNAVVLVPEISLTPQIVGRITARFGNFVAVLHSALSPGERFDEWHRLARGEARIAVGPRSALFAPLANLGLIIMDEEHEPAYKQEAVPRYHARRVAWELARRHDAALVLGSATPDVETYFRATQGEIELFELPERVDSRPLPIVHLVDLRQDVFIGEGRTFSEPLLAAMESALGRGEQVILFLNRRGFSTFVACRRCGWRLECPHCGVSLTYHHRTRAVLCHYCGYKRNVPAQCESCKSEDVSFQGLGTERVAEQLQRRFPGVTVARMDRETVRRKGAHREILARFARGDAQVLVGTQMVAKGLDFPGVTLVGVINADVGLAWPDFRAVERTFQLLTQVAGRAGRADKPGLVIVQTYHPEHRALQAAAKHDYAAFYAHEIAERQRLMWPPFVHLARLLFTDADQARARAAAQTAVLTLQDMGINEREGTVHYLGWAAAPLERLRGQWRFHVVLKGIEREPVLQAIAELVSRPQLRHTMPVVDIDPVDMI